MLQEEEEEEDSVPMKNYSHLQSSNTALLVHHLHETPRLQRILNLFSCIQAMSKKKTTATTINKIPALLLALALVVLVPSASAQTATDRSNSSSSFPLTFSPADVLLINCGASGTGEDSDGRTWKGDAGTPSLFSPATMSFQSNAQWDPDAQSDPDSSPPSDVPYATVRIFDGETTYRLKVRPGRHLVRLHFYPAWYAGLDPAKALFSVESGPYSLFRNFSTYITAQANALQFIMREFSIVVSSTGVLDLKFSPEPPPAGQSGNSSGSYYYAFVNGIEVISMPDMFVQGQLVGASASFPISDYYAMQTMARANVGGGNIALSQDSNLSRTWYDDPLYVYGSGGGVQISADPNSEILYTSSDPGYFAPTQVYATARSMGTDSNFNLGYNLTWLLAIDVNFTYLTRLHFCELIYTKPNQRVFDIYINNQTAMTAVDVIALAEQANPNTPKNTPVYLDFVVYVDDSHDDNIWIALHPNTEQKPQYYDSILNGIEIFKLNDSTGNLAGPNPVPQPSFASPPMSPLPAKAKSSSKGPMMGLIVGAVLACVLVGCIVACCWRKKRYSEIDGSSGGWIPLIMNSFCTASRISTKSTVSSAPVGLCRHFTFAELKQATDNFDESRLLGVGGFGNAYRGVVDGNVEVAVKRGNPQSEQGVTEFQTEIEMLSKLRHKHLVSLIGCCAERDEMILVYDYMGNEALRSHLYKGDSPPLTWKQRLEICIGAARGLHYLHTGARHTIIHRDVKSTNILLDKNFVAKVSDFGLSKDGPALDHTHVSTVVKGSFGYLDPEYFRRQQLTEKSDVYSFGVVLFEVLCARPALNPALPREQVSLAEWALHCKKKGTLNHIMDPNLKGTINPDSLKKFADIAEKCLAENGVDRPSMGDVLSNLEFSLQLHVQTIAMEGNAVDDSVIEMGGDPEKFSSGSSSKEKSMDGRLQGMSVGGKSTESEESEVAVPSLVFSQLVNPTGRRSSRVVDSQIAGTKVNFRSAAAKVAIF